MFLFKWLNGNNTFTNFTVQKHDRQKQNKTADFVTPAVCKILAHHTSKDDKVLSLIFLIKSTRVVCLLRGAKNFGRMVNKVNPLIFGIN